MLKSRLRRVAEKLCNIDLTCEYSSICPHYKPDSETCINALYKSYCGVYKQFIERDNL